MTLQYACFVKRLCLVICLTVVASLGGGESVAKKKHAIEPPPIEGPKASVTVNSLEAKDYKRKDFVLIRVFSDKDGCPDGKRVGLILGAGLNRKNRQVTFDVPVGNNIYIYCHETVSDMLTKRWCQTAFRFRPKDAAHYNLHLASKLRGTFAEHSCSYSFSVMDGGRETSVESFLPIRLIPAIGGPKFDQSMCHWALPKTPTPMTPTPSPKTPDRCTPPRLC